MPPFPPPLEVDVPLARKQITLKGNTPSSYFFTNLFENCLIVTGILVVLDQDSSTKQKKYYFLWCLDKIDG